MATTSTGKALDKFFRAFPVFDLAAFLRTLANMLLAAGRKAEEGPVEGTEVAACTTTLTVVVKAMSNATTT